MRIAGDAAMKHPRLAVLALAAVHVLLFGLVAGTWNLPYGLVPAWGTLAQCEGYLLGLWAALGGKLSPWRAVIVAVGAAGWEWFIHPHLEDPFFIFDSTGTAFWATCVLLPARLVGLQLGRTTSDGKNAVRRLQFSIWQALEWMTAAAVFLAQPTT